METFLARPAADTARDQLQKIVVPKRGLVTGPMPLLMLQSASRLPLPQVRAVADPKSFTAGGRAAARYHIGDQCYASPRRGCRQPHHRILTSVQGPSTPSRHQPVRDGTACSDLVGT